jgi:hypothetical protein
MEILSIKEGEDHIHIDLDKHPKEHDHRGYPHQAGDRNSNHLID